MQLSTCPATAGYVARPTSPCYKWRAWGLTPCPSCFFVWWQELELPTMPMDLALAPPAEVGAFQGEKRRDREREKKDKCPGRGPLSCNIREAGLARPPAMPFTAYIYNKPWIAPPHMCHACLHARSPQPIPG